MFGPGKFPVKEPIVTDAQRKAKELVQTGMSKQTIAPRFGVIWTTIHNICKEK